MEQINLSSLGFELESKMGESLKRWNYQVLMLVQALVGAISPNFRMVAISLEDGEWVTRFYLEEYDEEDIDEVEEVM
ncbi:hypothetical protein [Pseudomonas mosselii]|uniref:hypothetical protein n=1 Tax=Pseudomonas mosselii TaxID=78327 RepID=UPI001BD2CE16|nr:hypothetical protein [Pseudomonas mosselii]